MSSSSQPPEAPASSSTSYSTSTPQRFAYASLSYEGKGIRLLRLHFQPEENGQLSCTLQDYDLTSKPEYKALSYTWGDALPVENIFINGRKFAIRNNLYQFLRVKSGEEGFCNTGLLWIDQLCIDQTNHKERSHQVGQMADIFESATEVIVWLGLPFPGSDLVIDSFEAPPGIWFLGLEINDVAPWRHFLALEYWNRLWVCQELLLASAISVQLGLRSWNWDCMASFAKCWKLMADSIEESQHFRFIGLFRWRDIGKGNGFTWEEALFVTAGCQCQELVDHVYGVLSIIKPELRIDVDYTTPKLSTWALVCRKESESMIKGRMFHYEEAKRLVSLMYLLWRRLELPFVAGEFPMYAKYLKGELTRKWVRTKAPWWYVGRRHWNKFMIQYCTAYFVWDIQRERPKMFPKHTSIVVPLD
jgi:hypothetical protein